MSATAPDLRVPAVDVVAWADVLARSLAPACERVVVAGSLRRGAATVGDVIAGETMRR